MKIKKLVESKLIEAEDKIDTTGSVKEIADDIKDQVDDLTDGDLEISDNAAKKAAEELFSGSISATNVPTINVISKNLNKNIIDFLVDIKFLTSKSEAKRLLAQNGLRLNKELLTDPSKIITESDFKDNSILLQKGKKTFLKVVLTEK